ncbi:MAG: nucleotidyltransferase family protein [Lachnospiraceae bacterium]|nr:nucleotidyltransferase family protein [Lachnospiraceae bacterium]
MLAATHSVLPVIYSLARNLPLSEDDHRMLEGAMQESARTFYQFLRLSDRVVKLFRKAEIPVAVLKGVSVACLYPMPEMRRSSDIDLLLLNAEHLKKAEELLLAAGYRPMEEQFTNHHREWSTPENRILELHTMVVEPMDDAGRNRWIEKRFQLSEDMLFTRKALTVSFPALPEDLLAFHLLLHMLMHFVGSGFGLKLLCDWVVFWNRRVSKEETERFLSDIRECRLERFLSAVTTICVRYFGLKTDGTGTLRETETDYLYEDGVFCKKSPDDVVCELMREILDAEKEKAPDSARMVALRGDGFFDYVREFHHQTVLAFPKLSKTIVLLPGLYLIVLVRFLKNNKTRRGGQSAAAILKDAGRRGRLTKKLL